MVTPDANVEAFGLMAVVTVLGKFVYGAVTEWLSAKSTGIKQPELKDLVDRTIASVLHDALDSDDEVSDIEDRLTSAIGKLALKMSVKLPEVMVRIAVEAGVLEFKRLVRGRRANQKAARELPAKADELRVMAADIAAKLATLSPDAPIDTLTAAKEAGTELLEVK